MKHWCKLKTDTINNETLFELPESAQLCYYKLHAIAAMCDAGGALVRDDGSPITTKGLAFRLHSTEEATGYNIAALVRAKLVNQTDGIISLPDFECESTDYTNAERQRRFRESKKALPSVTGPVTVTPDENSNAVTVTPVTPLRNTEEKRREEKKKEEKKKEVFAQSANPPLSNRRGLFFAKIADICKLPKDSKQHSKSINAAALWFEPKQIDPSRLDDFSEWWFKNDWRGQKGEHPQPGQIISEWLKFESNVTAKQSGPLFKPRNYRRPQVESTAADRAASETEIDNALAAKHAANLANPTAHIAKLTQRIQTAQRANTPDAQQYIARIQADLAEFKAQLAEYQQTEVQP